MALILTRTVNEKILIGPVDGGEMIEIELYEAGHGRAVLAFTAPRSIQIVRDDAVDDRPKSAPAREVIG